MGTIISETCQAIWYVLTQKAFIKAPTSKNEWLDIAIDSNNKWNFPPCLGAIDGKHIVIQTPPRSGATFFNYTKSFSAVQLAVSNANYEFTLVDIAEACRQSDAGIYNNSKLGMAIDTNIVNIPEPTTIN